MIPEPFRALVAEYAPTVADKGFYYECGIGWFPIIFQAATALHELNSALNQHYSENVEFRATFGQIKEKFGTLRMYVNLPIDQPGLVYARISEIVDAAEEASRSVCEYCGDPGTLGQGLNSWWLTLCNGCRKERDAD